MLLHLRRGLFVQFSLKKKKEKNTGLIESVGDGDDEDDDHSRWSQIAKMLVGG